MLLPTREPRDVGECIETFIFYFMVILYSGGVLALVTYVICRLIRWG